jgi:hypothetical protein
MKIHRHESSRPTPDGEPVARPSRRRAPGFPWSLASPRQWTASIASHVGVAVLTMLLLALVRHFAPSSAPGDRTVGDVLPPPGEISVDVRGGADAPEGPHIRAFGPGDHLDIVVRHNGHRRDGTTLLVRAQQLSGGPSSAAGAERPVLFLALDPRRAAWQEHSLHYQGRIDESLPLAPGLWRLTFMLGDRRRCEPGPLHVCARVDAWLRVLGT